MLSIEELESMLVDAINAAIERGFLLISGADGVRWNTVTESWEWDPEQCNMQACDLWGAVLLSTPGAHTVHRGDFHRAARCAVDVDFYLTNPDPDIETLLDSDVYQLVQSVVNGWDTDEFVTGHPDAYMLGHRLANIYRPLSVDVFNLSPPRTQPKSGPTMKLDDFADDEDEDGPADKEISGIFTAGSAVELVELSEVEIAAG